MSADGTGIKQTLPAGLYALLAGHGPRQTQIRWASSGSGWSMGLGFVLTFGYWCTDFLVIQRAMAADSEEAARRVPLIAAIPKMFFPFLVILPGLIAICCSDRDATCHCQAQTAAASAAAATARLPLARFRRRPRD